MSASVSVALDALLLITKISEASAAVTAAFAASPDGNVPQEIKDKQAYLLAMAKANLDASIEAMPD